MKNRTNSYAVALLMLAATVPMTMIAQEAENDSENTATLTTTTITGATGTITQLNYGSDGSVEEFLIGTNILLSFPTKVTGGVASLGAVGNSVTYSGTAVTNASGFQTVRVSSFTNNTTKATYTSAASTSTSTAYGPTSGTVKQLNYSPNGAIDAFLFTPSGSTTALLVITGSNANATLQPLLTVGATVSVTGVTRTNPTSTTCVATPPLQVVNASSLTIAGQTIVITAAGQNGGHGPGHH